MPEIKVTINNIEKLELRSRIAEEVEKGEVVDRRVITSVKFEYDGTPMMMNQVLLALANDHQVTAKFESPQAIMSLNEVEPETSKK